MRALRGIAAMGLGLAALLAAIPSAASTQLAAANAVAYLEASQNADGSWGATREVQPLYTSEAVIALRAAGQRVGAYYRGITWLANHAGSGADYTARRILALDPVGDDVSAERQRLEDSVSTLGYYGDGWGLSDPHAASALDSALALMALSELGFGADVLDDMIAATNFLLSTQDLGADLGWTATVGANHADVPAPVAGDPVVTALVLRSFAAIYGAITGHEPAGDDAAVFLLATVGPTSPPLHQAQAALALLRWLPGTSLADAWVAALEASQSASDGSWESDPYVTAVALQALSAWLGTDAAYLQQAIFVPDLGLRKALNAALGRNAVDAVTRGEIQGLTTLDASGRGIQDLTGIEEAQNLVSITLLGNQISDLTPLDLLPQLLTAYVSFPCDVDLDGALSVADVQLVLQATTGGAALPIARKTGADVAPPGAPDGVVTAGDLASILSSALGTSTAACGN